MTFQHHLQVYLYNIIYYISGWHNKNENTRCFFFIIIIKGSNSIMHV